jgi:SAM-dependent methyltransferase
VSLGRATSARRCAGTRVPRSTTVVGSTSGLRAHGAYSTAVFRKQQRCGFSPRSGHIVAGPGRWLPLGSSGMTRLPHLAANVSYWSSRTAGEFDLARRRWAEAEPCWGLYDIPESVARLLPDDVTGMQVAELGCGTGYVSAWLARAGARPIGIDPTPSQLRIAQRMQDETGLRFPLVQAAGEHLPLGNASVDLVISEYGAAIWADPHVWIPEVARILRPGGELVFLGNSTLLILCMPAAETDPVTPTLQRALRRMHHVSWPDDATVEFHLSPGDWIRLLRRNGLEILDLIELYGPEDETRTPLAIPPSWAQRWPVEEVWRARRSAVPSDA